MEGGGVERELLVYVGGGGVWGGGLALFRRGTHRLAKCQASKKKEDRTSSFFLVFLPPPYLSHTCLRQLYLMANAHKRRNDDTVNAV